MEGVPAASLRSVEDRFKRVLNSNVISDGNKSSIRLPGFKYDDFDRTGNLNITKLHRVLEHNRVRMFPWVRQLETTPTNFTLMLFGRHWRISRRLYECAAIELPLVTTWWPTHVGRSSIDVMQTLTDANTGQLLAECVFRGIATDVSSLKSVQLPEDIRQQVASRTSPGSLSFPRVPQPTDVPRDAFSCTLRVRYDDTDQLQHTTQANYIAFARECASQASAAGYFTRLTGDFAFYVAESLTSIHYSETFAGDELVVSTWEDAGDALLLHFVVRKLEKIACYVKMRVHDDKPASKL